MVDSSRRGLPPTPATCEVTSRRRAAAAEDRGDQVLVDASWLRPRCSPGRRAVPRRPSRGRPGPPRPPRFGGPSRRLRRLGLPLRGAMLPITATIRGAGGPGPRLRAAAVHADVPRLLYRSPERRSGEPLRRGRGLRTAADMVARARLDPLDLDGFLEARAGRRPSQEELLVTIDDAYRPVVELAAPVLRRPGVPPCCSCRPASSGGALADVPRPRAHPDCQGAAPAAGRLPASRSGAHGRDHRDLRGLAPAELERQVGRVLHESCGELLGREVRSLAYPYGGHDADARAAAERPVCGWPSPSSTTTARSPSPASMSTPPTPARSFRVKLDAAAIDASGTCSSELRGRVDSVRRSIAARA